MNEGFDTTFSQLPITDSHRKAITNAIGSWSFSAHAFTDDELLYGALLMFQHTLKDESLAQWRMSDGNEFSMNSPFRMINI